MKKIILPLLFLSTLVLTSCGVNDNDYYQYDTEGKATYLTVLEASTGVEFGEYHIKEYGSAAAIKGEVYTLFSTIGPYYEIGNITYSNGDEFHFDKSEWRSHCKKYGFDKTTGSTVFNYKHYFHAIVYLEPVNFTITYKGVEDVDVSGLPTTYNVKSNSALPEISKPGYDFVYWTVGDDVITSLPVTNPYNITLTANWVPKVNTISYVGTYDINNPNPTSYYVGMQPITLQPLANSAAYRFKGWKLNGQYVTILDPSKLSGDVVLEADIEFFKFSVKYYVDDTLYQEDEFDYFSFPTYKMPAVPSKDHYKNARWSEQINTYANYTVRALYDEIVYKINYVLPFAISNPNPTSYTYSQNKIALVPFADVAGQYTFDGFYYNGVKITEIDPKIGQDMTIEVRFNYVDYTAKYYVDDVLKVTKTFNISNLTKYESPTIPNKNHYSAHWSEEVTELKNYDRIDAIYTPTVYTISYSLPFEIENNNPTSFTYFDTEYDLIPFDDLAGAYTFDGFYLNNVKITKIDPTLGKNLSIECRFTFNKYTASYYANGELLTSIEFDYLTLDSFIEPTVPSLAHYSNGHWDQKVTELKNYTITAVYEVEKFTVHVSNNANIDNTDYQISYGEDLGALYDQFEAMDIPNRSFVGFYADSGATELLDRDTILEGETTIYARFEIAQAINDYDELVAISSSYSGAYVLKNDIDCIGGALPNLSSFKGTFNGKGHKIYNFVVGSEIEGKDLAVFGTNNGTIKNVSFENGNYSLRCTAKSTNTSIGFLTAVNNGTISNVSVKATRLTLINYNVAGTSAGTYSFESNDGVFAGNNTGRIEKCTIDDGSRISHNHWTYCWNTVNDVKFRYDTFYFNSGAIAGKNSGKVLHCSSAATSVGGMIKQNALTDKLESIISVGGIVGRNVDKGLIDYCQKSNSISYSHSQTHSNNENGWSYNGAVVWSGQCNLGGIVGSNAARVRGCFATGTMNLEANHYCYIGAAAGQNLNGGSIQVSYARNATVTARNTINNDFTYRAGAFIGTNSGICSYCYTADVLVKALECLDGNNRLAGFAAGNSGTFNNCFAVSTLEGFDNNVTSAFTFDNGIINNCHYNIQTQGDVEGFFDNTPIATLQSEAFLNSLSFAMMGYHYQPNDFPIIFYN